jgi:hypothetical protein
LNVKRLVSYQDRAHIGETMFKKIPHFWSISILLIAALLLPGCQTQNAPTTTAAVPVATESAPAATAETTQPPALVLNNGAYRVKAGRGTPFTDSKGNTWQADQGFSGGDVTDRDPGTKIIGTPDPDMFMTEHYAMDSFACRIPNGNYTANLYFAETYDGISGPGDRVFSFNVQGHDFKDFDVWVKAGGPYRPYLLAVPVTVTNGVFRIDFTSKIENPEINAIELIPAT